MSTKVTRRQFITASGLFAAWAALAACGPSNFLSPSPSATAGTTPSQSPQPLGTGPNPTAQATKAPEATGDALLAHVLRRLTFGAPPEMAAHARSIGVQAFIDEQLHPDRLDDSQLDPLLSPLTTLGMTAAQRLALPQKGQPAQELTLATLLRQVYSQRQLYEMVVDFWTNHFNIDIRKNTCRFLETDDDLQTIRPNALGKFGDLLSASAHSPAMLI